ncbi:unnamed protein product [Ambrosiozyma monospora]|uniref:Unnamed protein product n=1 Tax=Ambrosiozyma monospora TaxID=43982 RepID=A0A9W6Z7C1_AMBMO|nr:unnamed protein product [Ambrosiozyma monospora]
MHTKMILKRNSEALNADGDGDTPLDNEYMSFASLENSSPLSEDLRRAIKMAELEAGIGTSVTESPEIVSTSPKSPMNMTTNGNTNDSPKSTSTTSSVWYRKHADSQFEPEQHVHTANYEVYDEIMTEAYELDHRLNQAKPNSQSLAQLSPRDMELQLSMFECFQLTAKIHLRQSVMRTNSSSLEIQYLVSQLTKSIDIMLGTEIEGCLCFPLFIAGMNSIYKKDRRDMNRRFNEFITRYKFKNALRCQIIMKHIWRLNPKGDKCVDWYETVKNLGWDLSFA